MTSIFPDSTIRGRSAWRLNWAFEPFADLSGIRVNSVSFHRQARRAWLCPEQVQVAFAFDRATVQRAFQSPHESGCRRVQGATVSFCCDSRFLELGLTVLHFDKAIELGLIHRPSCGNTEPGAPVAFTVSSNKASTAASVLPSSLTSMGPEFRRSAVPVSARSFGPINSNC